MKISHIIRELEKWAPPSYQESYDNSGLLVGDPSLPLTQALVTLDITEEVVDEAIGHGCNLIIAHHPLIFKGLKSVTTRHWTERCVIQAIKNDVVIYAIHTNLDHVTQGVNWKIAEKIGLEELKILSPKTDTLLKLTTFAPVSDAPKVLEALFEAGAGEIGNYDHCSFQLDGTGSFRPSAVANPTIGQAEKDEQVVERRIEVILEKFKQHRVLRALFQSHPYEEVAHYLQPLVNVNQEVGAGAVGTLRNPLPMANFIEHLKKSMGLKVIKCTSFSHEKVETVAICGGAGSFLLPHAKKSEAQVFITSDFKYHDFFEAENQLTIMDIGHYESEVFTKELIGDRLKEKIANIALRFSEVDTNPIKYL